MGTLGMKFACAAVALSWAVVVAQAGLVIASRERDALLLAAWAGAPFAVYSVAALLVHRSAAAAGVTLAAVAIAGVVCLAVCYDFALHAPARGDEVGGRGDFLPVGALVLLGLPLLHWVFACVVGVAALVVNRSEGGIGSGEGVSETARA
jgi:hypothetical protein